MPYENEHSLRLLDPDTPHIRVGRTHGSGDGKVQGVIIPDTIDIIPDTIDIIWYITKKDGKEIPLAQALRFPVKKWTEKQARAWIKKNKIKGDFEPAKKEKQAMKNTAPYSACIFSIPDEVKTTNKEEGTFGILAYDGGIGQDPFWGNFVVDLKGLQFSKSKIVVLDSHDRTKRIGFTTKQNINGEVNVEGKFLPNNDAQQMREDLLAGLPMEASMGMIPSAVEYIKEGQSVEVNGHILNGPGTIFRKSKIHEISMCIMGAFDNTNSTAFSNEEDIQFTVINEETNMDILTLEKFNSEYPDLYKEVFEKGIADGEKKERDLFVELEKVCGQNLNLLITCYKEGKTKDEAQQMLIVELQKVNTDMSTKIVELEKTKTNTTPKVDPAKVEFSDDANKVISNVDSNSEEGLKVEFAKSKELQETFKDVGRFLAFKRAEKNGQLQIRKEGK